MGTNSVTYSAIQLVTQDSIAVLTFNRPKVLNAFNTVLVREVDDAMKRLSADDKAKVILVRGAGRAFSAGFDLKDRPQPPGSVRQSNGGRFLRRIIASL